MSLLIVRLVLGYPTWLMIFYSVETLPVGLVQTIQNLIPFITVIASYIILGESIHKVEIANMLASFGGVIIMIYFSTKQTQVDSTAGSYTLGIIMNSLAAVFLSVINVIIRKLNDVHFSVAAGFQSSGTLAFSLLTLVVFRTFFAENGFTYNFTFTDVSLLAINGLLNSLAQIFFVRAFQLVNPGRVVGLSFLSIVMGYGADAIIFSYIVQPFELVGAGIITVCSIIMFGL